MSRPTPSSGVSCLPRDMPGSERLALALREAPEQLDEVTRARLERNLVEAWRTRGAHAVPLPQQRAGVPRAVWMGSLAASAALGLVLGVLLLRGDSLATVDSPQDVAQFDVWIGDGAVQSGALAAGQVLESGKHGHIEVRVGRSRIDIAPESRVRFEQLDRDELRLSLVHGRVDVAFHPERKGEQALSVDTSAARISVVGTRFAVEAAAKRETRVRVSEGVVRVEPRRGGAAVLVRAGEQLTVPVEAEAQPSKAPLDPPLEPAPLSAADGADVEAASLEPGLRRSGRARPAAARDDGPEAYEVRLEAARQLLLAGKHRRARARLEGMLKASPPPNVRVEALVLMAESFTAQGQFARAARAYRRAVETAPREAAGHNALFALARLWDRHTGHPESAAAAYREYLAKAPRGALARQARDALCRLGKCP